MEWIYELAANLFGLSHDWAVLLVQLAIVLGGILLLIFLLPWLGARFKIEVYPQGCDQRQRSRSYVPYWQLWGQPGQLDVGVDFILEICMNHNLRRLVKNEPIDFDFSDIKRVVAAWAGYILGLRRWGVYRWIIELHNGQYRYIRGWYDPSRFEERTSLFTWSAETAEEAAEIEIQPEVLASKGTKEWKPSVVTDQDVYQSLLVQIKSGERDWSGFKLSRQLYMP